MPRLLAVCSCAVVALAFAASAAAQDFAPGELIVRFRTGADRTDVLAHRHAALRRNLGLRGASLIRLQAGDDVRRAAAELERDRDVLYAEPNYVFHTSLVPNDPGFDDTWGLSAISAPAAWDTTTGSTAVTVAVVDTGIDAAHPDLAPNIWTNPGETANGLDDDANGRVDDLHGWDFATGDANPNDDNGHGTHVSGTIGARGNDAYGVPGVAWNVKLMPLKAANAAGLLDAAWITDALTYACSEGARIVNGSFGGGGGVTVKAAIDGCPTTLFVFAAGNNGTNNDVSPKYPCAYDAPNILCVAATDAFDDLADFSNYGYDSVDLAAPGVDIVSTVPGNWAFYSGTSMASPHVAGAAALVASHRTALSPIELKNAILNGLDPVPGLLGYVGYAGRLNVNAALTAPTTTPVRPALPPPPPPPPAPADTTVPTDPAVASTSHVPGRPSIDSTVDMTWSGAFDYGSGIDGFSFVWDHAATTVPDTVKDAEESTGQATSAPLAPGTYWFHLRTRDNAGNWTQGTHAGPYVIAPAAVPQPKRCVVPRLRGKTRAAAAKLLKRAGCKLGPVKSQRSRMRKGRIVSQRPPAGRKVGKGTPVVVTVSRGMG